MLQCITVCPAEALEKDTEWHNSSFIPTFVYPVNRVSQFVLSELCYRFFYLSQKQRSFYNLNDEAEVQKFVDACPVRNGLCNRRGRITRKEYLFT
jgi:ferredoxin